MSQSGEILGFPVSKIEPILGFVADSIQFVYRIAPTKWGVTPCFPGVRLNAGFCEVLTAWPDEIRVLVHREFLPGRKPRGLRVEGLEDDFYRSAPGSALATMRPNSAIQIRKDLEAIREAHQACFICGINFGDAYGDQVAGLIHVHHLIPLSDVGRRYRVDPIADLRPVCPNCHAVIHAVVPARNIETVRSMLESGKE